MPNNIQLSFLKTNLSVAIQLPVSKSECNRILILEYVSNAKIKCGEISDSKDSQTLQQLLLQLQNGNGKVSDCGPAGTTFRFLLSVLAISEGEHILTGSDRMKERPIGDLVDALNQLGAKISYIDQEGFPPLKINGTKIKGGKIKISSSTSSQFISSLLLVGNEFENGLELNLQGEIVSLPYLEMTISLLKASGIECQFSNNKIVLYASPYKNCILYPERDWSAASYFYSLVALSKNLTVQMDGLKKDSLQGDAVLPKIYNDLGVKTDFTSEGIIISKNNNLIPDNFAYNFTDCPDLAQTLAFTCAGLKMKCLFTGLSTLKNKETDRIVALKNELEKCGAIIEIGNDYLKIKDYKENNSDLVFDTYHDHRMAMAAAPFALIQPITINDKNVVEKSFPQFWNELEKIKL